MKILSVNAGVGAVGGEACDAPDRSLEADQKWSGRYVQLSVDGFYLARRPSFH